MNFESDDEDDGDYGMDLSRPFSWPPYNHRMARTTKPFWEQPDYKFNRYLIDIFNLNNRK